MSAGSANDKRGHIVTVVVEEYFQVGAFRNLVSDERWERFDQRARLATTRALDLLDGADARATFFVAGWLAESDPALVADIARRGHEVATSGYGHCALRGLSAETFRDDVRRGRAAVEDATGAAVHGFRIARGRLTPADRFALTVLAEEGFAYDSSFVPLGRASRWPPERRIVHREQTTGGELWEVPVSSLCRAGLCIPICGGNYLRQLPSGLARRAAARWVKQHQAPLVLYFHVWELDPDQPRITAAGRMQRLRHYRNLRTMPERIAELLERYRFTSIAEFLTLEGRDLGASAALPAATAGDQRAGPRRPITVVVPCYNEQDSLPYLDKALAHFAGLAARDYDVRYLFVDDASTDATWNTLQRLFGDRPDCRLVRHSTNRGLAGATHTGLVTAQDDIVCVIDCDCSYDPVTLLGMVPLLGDGVAVVTASPYHRLGAVKNVPAWRLALSKSASWLYRRVLRHKLATYTSCFRVYRRDAVVGIRLDDERFLGVVELIARLDVAGRRIVEHPAVLEMRLLGRSKMRVLGTALGHLRLLARCALWRLSPPDTR